MDPEPVRSFYNRRAAQKFAQRFICSVEMPIYEYWGSKFAKTGSWAQKKVRAPVDKRVRSKTKKFDAIYVVYAHSISPLIFLQSPFINFQASKYVNLRKLCSPERSINGFGVSEITKKSVGSIICAISRSIVILSSIPGDEMDECNSMVPFKGRNIFSHRARALSNAHLEQWPARRALSQFWSFKIRRTTFLN